jgi:hypothetical protein
VSAHNYVRPATVISWNAEHDFVVSVPVDISCRDDRSESVTNIGMGGDTVTALTEILVVIASYPVL